MKITYTNCPVCHSEKIGHALNAKDYTVSSEEFEVWDCLNCKVRFTQDVPRETEIGQYYQSDEYVSHSNTRKGLVNRLYHIVRSYTLMQKRKRIGKITGLGRGKILDIGCGTGEFLNSLKIAGWETLGLEPDEVARNKAINTYDLNILPTTDLFSLKENTFDVITMWHVLEHVHQLHEYLERIHKILKKSGILCIAVPNYTSLDANHYQSSWAAYDVPRHLYHFSPTSMKHLLSKHKLEIHKTLAMPFDAFYVSLLSEKYMKGHLRIIPGFMVGMKSYLKMQGNVDTGSSVLYVAKKIN